MSIFSENKFLETTFPSFEEKVENFFENDIFESMYLHLMEGYIFELMSVLEGSRMIDIGIVNQDLKEYWLFHLICNLVDILRRKTGQRNFIHPDHLIFNDNFSNRLTVQPIGKKLKSGNYIFNKHGVFLRIYSDNSELGWERNGSYFLFREEEQSEKITFHENWLSKIINTHEMIDLRFSPDKTATTLHGITISKFESLIDSYIDKVDKEMGRMSFKVEYILSDSHDLVSEFAFFCNLCGELSTSFNWYGRNCKCCRDNSLLYFDESDDYCPFSLEMELIDGEMAEERDSHQEMMSETEPWTDFADAQAESDNGGWYYDDND